MSLTKSTIMLAGRGAETLVRGTMAQPPALLDPEEATAALEDPVQPTAEDEEAAADDETALLLADEEPLLPTDVKSPPTAKFRSMKCGLWNAEQSIQFGLVISISQISSPSTKVARRLGVQSRV